MYLARVLVVLILASTMLSLMPPVRPALAQPSGSSILSVSPVDSSSPQPNSSFTPSISVNVNLDLSSVDGVSGYDIFMSYNNSIVTATSLLAGNLFPASRIVNATYCVNGSGYNCTGYDSINIVHWSLAYLDGVVSGPLTATVFTVQFSVRAIGHSFFGLTNGTSGSPVLYGAVGASGLPPPVPHETLDGVYSNDGLQAFFNVTPDTPLVNNAANFDASGSFNPQDSSASYRSGLSYVWSFGDSQSGSGVTVSHKFTSPGTYAVGLTVIDQRGTSSAVTRKVVVVIALGGLLIAVRDMNGKDVSQSLTLKLYNGSSLVETLARKAGDTNSLAISGLTQGTYLLDVSGSGIKPASKNENVVAGVVTSDVVYVDAQSSSSGGGVDPWLYLLIGIVATIFFVGGFLPVLREELRKRKRPSRG